MNKNLIAFFIFLIFWSSLLIITGTLTSGFHFTDDHTLITISKNIQENGILNSLIFEIKNSITVRLVPFTLFVRVILVKLLGTNFLLWSIFHLSLAVLTSYFLFLFIYRQGYIFLHALMFPFLTLIGGQSAIWWRLGTGEAIGIFLLSVSLFLLVTSINKHKSYQLIFSIIFLFFASLSKESFILFIPAYILILIWLKQQCDPDWSIFNIVRANLITIISLITILSLEIVTIIFVIGTNKMGYAGIDNSFSIIHFQKFIYSHLRFNKYSYLILFGLFLLLQNVKIRNINIITKSSNTQYYSYNTAIFLAIILPQFLLYFKSGLVERYLLPINLGFSLFVFVLLYKIYESKGISSFSKRTYIFLILLFTITFFKNGVISNAKSFSHEGKSTNRFLSTIVASTKPSDSILVVLNGSQNNEMGNSIYVYLSKVGERKNISFFPQQIPLDSDFKKSLDTKFYQSYKKQIIIGLSNRYSCIAVLPFDTNEKIKNDLNNNYLYKRTDFEIYKEDDINKYSIYSKR